MTTEQQFSEGQAVWWHSGGNAAHPAGRAPATVVRYSVSRKRVYIRYSMADGIPWHVFVHPSKLEARDR